MYHALLTNRYLTSRVIPLIAVAAVALCVALVIIVVSVMTGFLNMVRDSGRTLMGDVVISYPVTGIPHYERLIEQIEELPEAEAATPVVDSWGLLKMPYPDGTNKDTETVQIWGIEPDSFAKVTGYADTLYWRPPAEQQLKTMADDDPRRQMDEQVFLDGLTLHDSRSDRAGIVLGIHISIGNDRQSDGSIRPARNGYWWMPQWEVTLTTLPIATGGGLLEPESRIFPVVNEFFSGVFLIDDKRAMIPLEIAQRMLHLNEGEIVDEEQLDDDGLPKVIGVDPAKATMVLVRAAEGVEPDELREQLVGVYDAFRAQLLEDNNALVKPPPQGMGLSIKTWEQQQADFIEPIEKERELMRTLFSLVYLVCAGLVLAIFWAIVYEKTRDIGILRSIGASRFGISWIFLRYGLVIGIAGALVGVGLAYLVVRNINTIHSAMGDPPMWLAIIMLALALVAIALTIYHGRRGALMPITLGLLVSMTLIGTGAVILVLKDRGGVVIWDPSVYYFTTIPNEMDTGTAIFTMIGAVIFSLIGAFLPAAKAADTDPVRALHYE
ncbi:MAG: ABC transporter permease [Planctomycetota bacterium]|nr:ABC transporter permease [Planctomycetota bacterium]